MYDYICVESEFKAGNCKNMKGSMVEGIKEGVKKNLMTDHLVETAFWDERKMAKTQQGKLQEKPWSTPNTSWESAYQTHRNNVKNWYKKGFFTFDK